MQLIDRQIVWHKQLLMYVYVVPAANGLIMLKLESNFESHTEIAACLMLRLIS